MKKLSTELFAALASDRLDRLQSVLRKGGSPNARDERGILPLQLAIRAENVYAVRALLDAGAEVNPNVRYASELPIMIAAKSSDPEMLRLLLERGAFPGPFDGRYVSAFHVAICRCRRRSAQLLLAHGFDVNAMLETRLTPLMLAAREGCAELVRDFLNAGAVVDRVDDQGRTALFWAIVHNSECPESERIAEACHVEVVLELLSAGSNPHHRDREGRSVLNCALERGNQDIVDLLSSCADARPHSGSPVGSRNG